MGQRVGAACSPDKVGSSRSRPRRGAGVAVWWGGRLHGGEHRKASSVLPITLTNKTTKMKNNCIYKNIDTLEKARQFASRFIYKKLDTLRYAIYNENFEVGIYVQKL